MVKKAVAKTALKKQAKSSSAAAAPEHEQMEAMLQHLFSMMGAEGVSPEDLKAFRVSLGGPSPNDRLSDAQAEAKDEAQQIAFDAMEATSDAQARKLAKRALRLDPDCIDALVVLVNLDAHSSQKRIEGLREAIVAGERSLGEKFLREHKGDFWLLMETRPYMRALEQFGGELRSVGMNTDAIAVYEKMLKLNPNDNQGVRDPLLGLYLAVDDLAGAQKLLKKYKGDASANFLWGRVLERFLAGDPAAASAGLTKAVKANRHVVQLLTGQRAPAKSLPEMYSLGSEEEAVLCHHWLGAAWIRHAEASSWLRGQCANTK